MNRELSYYNRELWAMYVGGAKDSTNRLNYGTLSGYTTYMVREEDYTIDRKNGTAEPRGKSIGNAGKVHKIKFKYKLKKDIAQEIIYKVFL